MSDMIQQTQQDNGVVIITFDRPEKLNALDIPAMIAFRDAIQGLQEKSEDELRAVVLTGAGDKAFCSGGDLVALSNHPSADDARYFIQVMGEALNLLETLPVPVIAAINGYALGGGSEMALACDIRIAGSKARFGMIQIENALIPGFGGGQRLLRTVGYALAIELLLESITLTAAEAQQIHLINQVVDAGTALDTALFLANDFAARSPAVVRAIKHLLLAGLRHPYAEAQRIEQELFPGLWEAKEHREAVERFLKRRSDQPQKE